MKRLFIENIGPIEKADISFGDLTVLLGPQASGKTTFLQFLRLSIDGRYIAYDLKERGLQWGNDFNNFLQLFLGEGMGWIWSSSSSVKLNGQAFQPGKLLKRVKKKEPTIFHVPAQRVVTIADGWPRRFLEYGPDYPFSVREFGELLRRIIEGNASSEILFPNKGRLGSKLREMLDREIFRGYSLKLEKIGLRRKLTLSHRQEHHIPIMSWSAGQREFSPFLLSLNFLAPSSKVSMRDPYRIVIIEEPEMGLHPKAIWVVMLSILELLKRGYKVIISTHSVTIMDALWAIREIQLQVNSNKIRPSHATKLFQGLFEVKGPWGKNLAELCLHKKYRTYYFHFDGQKSTSQEISSLDPGDINPMISEWGYLTAYSSRAQEIVAKAYNYDKS